MKESAVFRALLITAIFTSVISGATKSPTSASNAKDLTWYSGDRDLVDGETVTGYKRVIALLTPSYGGPSAKKWCVYVDNVALEGASYDPNFSAPWPAASTPVYIYHNRGVVSRGAGKQSSPGCWTPALEDEPYGLDITLNSSTWTDGPHVVTIEATLSNDTALTLSRTVLSENVEPKVEWLTSQPFTRSSEMLLSARITPGANRITKACLARDGKPVLQTENATFSGDTQYGNTLGNRGPYGTFGSSSGGCVSFSESQAGNWPVGLWKPTTLTISLKTGTWASTPKELRLTIVESITREFVAVAKFGPDPTTTTSSTATTVSRPTTTLSTTTTDPPPTTIRPELFPNTNQIRLSAMPVTQQRGTKRLSVKIEIRVPFPQKLLLTWTSKSEKARNRTVYVRTVARFVISSLQPNTTYRLTARTPQNSPSQPVSVLTFLTPKLVR